MGGGGPSGSRYHPYIRDDHHRSSREEISRRSRDHHRRHGSDQRSRTHRHHGHRSRETERGSRHQHRHHEDIESRVSSLAIPRLPAATEERIKFFSAQQTMYNRPIEMICSAIEGARQKVLLKIYHITSEKIIASLVKQSQRVPVHVHYQKSFNIEGLTAGSNVTLDHRKCSAILHKKTLFVDSHLVISGSGNYTDSSFTNDLNLTVRMRGSKLYHMVSNSLRGTVDIGNQLVDYHPLAKVRHHGNNHRFITRCIDGAETSILVAMSALSHSDILESLEKASERGVLVKIIIDTKEKSLTQQVIRDMRIRSHIYERTCENTVHTKVCCIDNRILIFGSVNWTRGGLNKNLEDLFILRPLTEIQLQCFMELWKFLEQNCRPFTPDFEQPSTSSSST